MLLPPGLKAARAAIAAMKQGPLPIIRRQWNMTATCSCGALMDRRSTRCAACYRKSQAERNRAVIGIAAAVPAKAKPAPAAPPRDAIADGITRMNATIAEGKATHTSRFELVRLPSGSYIHQPVTDGKSDNPYGSRILYRFFKRADGTWDERATQNEIMRVRHSGKPKEAAQEAEQDGQETEADPEPLSEEEIAAALA